MECAGTVETEDSTPERWAVYALLSWFICFKALKLADASKVGPIDKLAVPIAVVLAVFMLGERPSLVNWLGIALVCGGADIAAFPAK